MVILRTDARGTYYLRNGELLPINSFHSVVSGDNISIYEVVRVVDGVVLFLEEHLERLMSSAQLTHHKMTFSLAEIERHIAQLVEANKCNMMNLRVDIAFHKENQLSQVYMCDTVYPEPQEYTDGVYTVLMEVQRHNPNAKIVNASYKRSTADFLKQTGAYEALLVNHEGLLTEGSKSNFFYIVGERAYTAPLGMVLGGITRQHIIKACRDNGIEMREEALPSDEIAKIDGCFLSGTSPKVLPISKIDAARYTSAENPVVRKIMQAYDMQIADYINSRKKLGER